MPQLTARRVLQLLIALILFQASVAAISAAQAVRTGRRLQAHLETTESNQLDAVRTDARRLRRQLWRVRVALWPIEPLLRASEPLGRTGADVAATATLLGSSTHLLNAWQQLDPLLDSVADTSQPAQLLAATAAASAELTAARAQLARAHALRAQLDTPTALLHPTVGARLRQLDTALGLADSALAAADALPLLLGQDAPHHMLVLLLNTDELRPSGGFITGSVYVTLEDGAWREPIVLTSEDPSIDRLDDGGHSLPPEPLIEYMGLPIWIFRDANWSADFPTAARKAAELYTRGREEPVTTVVTLNQRTLALLIDLVGPIELDDGQLVDGDTVVELVRDAWQSDRARSYLERKAFISQLAPALFEQGVASLNGDMLLNAAPRLLQAGAEKEILLYSAEPTIQAFAQSLNWDGALTPPVGDAIYLVHANLGFDKSDLNMRRAADYHVTLADRSAPYARLTWTQENVSYAPEGLCSQRKVVSSTEYVQQATDCNADYLQIYLASNASVVSLPTLPIPPSFRQVSDPGAGRMRTLRDQFGYRVVAGLIVTPPQETTRGDVISELDSDTIFTPLPNGRFRYHLNLRRQPGMPVIPFTVTIDLPRDAALLSADPLPTLSSADAVYYELSLERDTVIELIFE